MIASFVAGAVVILAGVVSLFRYGHAQRQRGGEEQKQDTARAENEAIIKGLAARDTANRDSDDGGLRADDGHRRD